MIKLFTVLILLMATASGANPAMAQENLPAACKLLPEANNVVYQAGVDVDGNAVVPADLNAANSSPLGDVLNIIKVPLEFDLAQRISGLNLEGAEALTSLGMLEIHQTGKVMYNGQDITKPVMTLCAKSHKEVTVEVVDAPVEKPVAPTPAAPMAKTEAVPAPELQAPKLEIPQAPVEPAIAEAATMPAVKAPTVEFLDELTPTKERMANMDRPKISEPASPKQALVGIPKKTPTLETSDIIKGQDYRNYNE